MPTCALCRNEQALFGARRNGVPWVRGRVEVGVPGVEVGVEMHERDRPVDRGSRP